MCSLVPYSGLDWLDEEKQRGLSGKHGERYTSSMATTKFTTAELMAQAQAVATHRINRGRDNDHNGTADCADCVAAIAVEFRERLRNTLTQEEYENAVSAFATAFRG